MTTAADNFVVPKCNEEIKIVYQDDDLLIINKPAKLLSLSGKNPLNKDSVHYRLVKLFPSATMVHRLDFATSGLLILALNKQANGEMTKLFQQRFITKTYTAILQGHVKTDEGLIDFPIVKGEFPHQKICQQTGKSALSQFKVLERIHEPRSTRVLFTPLTGRTHQLRIHSLNFGHPILGCDLYHSEDSYQQSSRLLLHARSLQFSHPITKQEMQVDCPCPF